MYVKVDLGATSIVPNAATSNINGFDKAPFRGRDNGIGSGTGTADR